MQRTPIETGRNGKSRFAAGPISVAEKKMGKEGPSINPLRNASANRIHRNGIDLLKTGPGRRRSHRVPGPCPHDAARTGKSG